MSGLEAAGRRFIAGNWKMYKTVGEALVLIDRLLEASPHLPASATLLVFPSFTALAPVAERCRGSRIAVGGQNLHPAAEGAFTGEVSPPQLRDAGARYVLVGHSERRQLFGETDALLARKVASALAHELVPIYCLGETLAERDAGKTEEVLARQVKAGIGEFSSADAARILLAYEPVWAIGTGRTATAEQARLAHRFLRGLLCDRWGRTGDAIPLLYGGSVKPENAGELMGQPDVNGVLVGGASLVADSFLGIATA